LGLSSMDALSMFLSQWFYGGRDLEEAFEEIGESIRTFAHVAGWKTKNGKCLFIFPYVHFGPFGNLGGSQLTSQISKALSHEGEIFVFHPTVTHDFNPVSAEEAQKAISACKQAASSLSFSPAKGFVSFAKAGSVSAHLIAANNCALASYGRAPFTTEDVDFSIGLALMQSLNSRFKHAAVFDQHNAETGDVNTVGSGNPISFEMLAATQKLLAQHPPASKLSIGWCSSPFSSPCIEQPRGAADLRSGTSRNGISLGCSSQRPSVACLADASVCSIREAPLPSMGTNGIKAASIRHAKGIYSMLLFDANGIVPSFREQLISELQQTAKQAG